MVALGVIRFVKLSRNMQCIKLFIVLTSTLISRILILLPGKHRTSRNSKSKSFLLWIEDLQRLCGMSMVVSFGTGEMYAEISSSWPSNFVISSDKET